MTSVQDSYLGWDLLAHRPECKRPSWTVELRDDHRGFRRTYEGPGHSCPNEDCGHDNRYTETTVRIVCSSCGSAHLLHGEDLKVTTTSTAHLGYGLAPRKVAGLYLWPGEPWLYIGRAVSDEPHDFLVTRNRVQRVSEADVAGTITQARGRRGGVLWSAAAVPSAEGPYGISSVRFARVAENLRSVAAAAKWISGQLAEKDTRKGDVHSADHPGGGEGR